MSITEPTVPPVVSTYTPVSSVGAQLCAAMAPWLTEHLAWYLDAIGVMLSPVADLVQDVGADDGTPTVGTYDSNGNLITSGYQPGYGALLNPQAGVGSDLPYLGQFVGVSVPAGSTDSLARSLVTAEAGMARAKPDAVIAAAQRNLSATQSVTLLERTYGPTGARHPGWFTLIVRPEEVISTAALVAAVNAVKLSGLMWTLITTDGFPWSGATGSWSATPLTWAQAAFSNP